MQPSHLTQVSTKSLPVQGYCHDSSSAGWPWWPHQNLGYPDNKAVPAYNGDRESGEKKNDQEDEEPQFELLSLLLY